MRDDELHAFVPPDKSLEILCDRRKAAAAVDEDRHRSLDSEGEHWLKPLVIEGERLRSRMQLDAARAEIEAASCLLERLRREIEADERDELPSRSLGVGERPVVGNGERRLAVVLVEAEHERAAEAVTVEKRRQLVVASDHPVDVVSEMGVDVEEVGVLGQLAPELLVPRLNHGAGSLERGHDRSASQTRGGVIGSSRGRVPVAAATAFATAAGAPTTDASPMPLAPNGPSGAGTSTMSVSISGTRSAVGIA